MDSKDDVGRGRRAERQQLDQEEDEGLVCRRNQHNNTNSSEPNSNSLNVVVELQSQLQETQRFLANHIKKVRTLGDILTEPKTLCQSTGDAMKRRKVSSQMLVTDSHCQVDDDSDSTSG